MQRISRASRSCEAADVVDDREGADVVEQRVDGEVAPEGVFLRRAVGVVALDQPIAARAARGARCCRVSRRRAVQRLGRSDQPSRSASSASAISASGVSSRRSTCRRNVATSIVLVPNLTCARRKRRPMIQQLRNSFLTWCGMRRRADVEVLGPAIQQQVANAAADQIGDVVVLVEPVEDLESVGIDVCRREIGCADRGTMVGSAIEPRL